ncbi:AAA family ATPase [Neomicrococcus aestuarii]|nr:AAA family ATPase [Neomicrococcus aestuarii]
MTSGRVHLLYGLAGSGKSTLARLLCVEGRAVRFTLDEWMLRLYPGLHFDSIEYGVQAAEVRELIWSTAEQVVTAGVDVVLDWNSWSTERRAWAVARASAVAAPVTLRVLSTSLEVSSQRAAARTAAGEGFFHPVTRSGNEHLAGLMQEPDASEGFTILHH